MFYEIDIERHRVRLMAYENRNAAYDLSLFDDSSDYVPGSAAPERKEEVHKKQERKRRNRIGLSGELWQLAYVLL